MANKPGNRQLVSYCHNFPISANTSSIPLSSWSGVWHSIRGSPSTRRPPQNPSPAIWTKFTPRNNPRDFQITELDSIFLARYNTFSSTDRVWISTILHKFECSAAECCAIKSPTLHWSLGERSSTELLLVSAEVIEPCEPYNRRHS